MESINFLDLFQGIATLAASEPSIMFSRIFLIFLGMLLIYLGRKEILEPLLMIPMGLGMAAVNAGVLFFEGGKMGTLFIDPLAGGKQVPGGAVPDTVHRIATENTIDVLNALQIDFLQPVYTLTFSNGLIAVLVFMGIGVLLDVGFVMARPFQSMFVAICGELGTAVTFPVAVWLGLTEREAAAVAMIGGADGPMVLFASLVLAKHLFVPITVVGYLYLGLTYGGYPFLIKALVPHRLRACQMPFEKTRTISAGEKLLFAVVTCVTLCLLFPVAAPLFLALFVGVAVRESGITHFSDLFGSTFLYGATFFLGLVLGVLCEANTLLDPTVLKLLLLGIFALTISAIGGLIGGYVLYFATHGKYNPVIGIAAVSCVPTTSKVAQKVVSEARADVLVMPHALGVNISGVITSAIFAAAFVTLLH
ncbi:Oxaloacetate decarboxylase beta chain @ Methylmalonyl-CoA decarboxylase, beta chain [invertebrate metagenome]|uniref:Oxaloacetate decarboxylase beta chain @ Methylmalonyl-CoA decarboxylase, beta chain n=1 Tax=invertebrate metagenome TaxID=1711999 RepID=A0A484H6Y7_9ZZZZ